MPSKRLIPGWRPRKPPINHHHGTRVQYWVDYEKEHILYYDGNVTHEFALGELSGKTLTHCMMEGVITFLKESADPHTAWLGLRRGYKPRSRRIKYDPPRQLATLPKTREAIVLAMLDYGDHLTREQAVAKVLKLTNAEVKLWLTEPDVLLHYRALSGEQQLRLAKFVDEVKQHAAD